MGYRPKPVQVPKKEVGRVDMNAKIRTVGYILLAIFFIGFMFSAVFALIPPTLVTIGATLVMAPLYWASFNEVKPKSKAPELEVIDGEVLDYSWTRPKSLTEAWKRTAESEHELGWLPHGNTNVADVCEKGCNKGRILFPSGRYGDAPNMALGWDDPEPKPMPTKGVKDNPYARMKELQRQISAAGISIKNMQAGAKSRPDDKIETEILEKTRKDQFSRYLEGMDGLVENGILTPNELRGEWLARYGQGDHIVRAGDGQIVAVIKGDPSSEELYAAALAALKNYHSKTPVVLPPGIEATVYIANKVDYNKALLDFKEQLWNAEKAAEAKAKLEREDPYAVFGKMVARARKLKKIDENTTEKDLRNSFEEFYANGGRVTDIHDPELRKIAEYFNNGG